MFGPVGKYFSEIFTDVRGSFSSKRTVVFFCVIMMIVSFVAHVFLGFTVPQWMFESIMYVVIGGLGFVGAEHIGQFRSGGGGGGYF